MYQWQYRFVQEPLIPYKFQISYTFIYQVINQIHAHKVIKNPTRKRHISTQLTSMMNQIHWRCQWLNVLSMKSFFFERMRLLGTWRSVPRDRASFEQVEFSLSSFSSPRSPTPFSVSLPFDPQLQFFYFSQTGWTVAAIFGTVHLPSTRYTEIRSLSFSLRGSFVPQAPILCFRTRTTDPWKCRNLAMSLNSVRYASSTRILHSYRWFATRLRHFLLRGRWHDERRRMGKGWIIFPLTGIFPLRGRRRSFFISYIWLLTHHFGFYDSLSSHDRLFRI